MKNKILICSNHSFMLYRFRKELIEELMKSAEVILCMPFVGHEEDFQRMGLSCIEADLKRRSMNPLSDMMLFKYYAALLKKVKPDKVITYSIKPNLYMGILCRLYGIPYYMNVQGLGTAFENPFLSCLACLFYKTASKKAQCVFFENKSNAAFFYKKKIVKKKKIHVLNGAGVNLEIYRYHPMCKNDKRHFLYLGRIMREKGMNELFQAAERLHKDGYDFILDLVGFFEEESFRNKIEVLQKKGIVIYHGFQNKPEQFYQKADCIVMPSYHEGMSNVNLEAAATGRCVITTDVPGCREAVEHGKTGFLVKKADTESLYKAMKKVLLMESKDLNELGKEGRKKMEREFDRRQIAAETKKRIGEQY